MKGLSLILAFYLFIGSLIPRMDFSQLLHIPDMIAHYQVHHEESHEIGQHLSFLKFIQSNIFSPSEHQHEHHSDHENQPCFSFHSSVLFFILPTKTVITELAISLSKKEVAYQNNFYLTGFSPSLIQPPSTI